MRHKGSLMLMELLVMVLVFALAAAGCIRCFLWAEETSEETALRDQAVALARNTAEALKTAQGDAEEALAMAAPPEGLQTAIEPLAGEVPGLGEAEIAIRNDRGEILFSLTAAWQEEIP